MLGTRLASGSLDSEIIIWDAVEEAGLYRLSGHKDKINGLQFLTKPNAIQESFLVSVSADRTIKIWELESQHCQERISNYKLSIFFYFEKKICSMLIY